MQSLARLKWLSNVALAALVSLCFGGLVAGTLFWAAARSDEVAGTRQRDLAKLIVSKAQIGVAHDQESATVWDDAVREVSAGNLEWIDTNLGQWMHTYFGHDVALVTAADGKPIYQFSASSDEVVSPEQIQAAYQPLAETLRQRLAAEATEGVNDRVLTIGESDITQINGHPAIVSVKPIVSDTGDIEQTPGQQNLHIAIRYLDGSFPLEVGNEYQFSEMTYESVWTRTGDRAFIPLEMRSGGVVGYLTWRPFQPGRSVLHATLPTVGVIMALIFIATIVVTNAIRRRSDKLSESRQQLSHLALHDPLTGLANRTQFSKALERCLSSASEDQSTSVLFVDLDRFKAVNDTFGHPVGDRLLTLVAERMREIIPSALIARIGGDEFNILLQNTDEQAIVDACGRIVKNLHEPFMIDGRHISIGASVGASSANGAIDPFELTRQADIALYHAKAAGRNTYALFGEHMDELLRTRRALEQDLRLALMDGTTIEAVFQPVFAADTGELTSMEALARWNHKKLGPIAPDIFIPLAEETGLIADIGQIILDDTCRCLVDAPSTVSIAVNVSAIELASPSFPLRVLSTLERWEIDPSRLELEITESVAVEKRGAVESNIASLRGAGVRFAIDDFGTGYSSFARIRTLEIDRMKIDRSFIQDMEQSGNKELVSAMIAMAHARGMKITAEGVETLSQCQALKALRCDNLQGYLLSKPLSRDMALSKIGSDTSETLGPIAKA